MKTIIFITFLTFLLTSCASLKEAGQVLRNEKVKNTDEFLVKKKEPLILPPNYEKIPEPGSINKTETQDKDKIKKILPNEEDGLHIMKFINSCVNSSNQNSRWIDLNP